MAHPLLPSSDAAPNADPDQTTKGNVRPATNRARYILLVRHGSVARNPGIEDSEAPLSEKGIEEAHQVAGILAETLALARDGEPGVVGEVCHASSHHARQMAEILYNAIGARAKRGPGGLKENRGLDAATFRAQAAQDTRAFAATLRGAGVPAGSNVLIVVGHQPQLGWIAHELLGQGVPIDHSEIVCVEPDYRRKTWPARKGRLLWSIGPSDPETLNLLREKIRSKMNIAKVLGALILPLLTFPVALFLDSTRLRNLIDNRVAGAYPYQALIIAALLLIVGLVLYLATVYAYDRLLMPTRFWSEVQKSENEQPDWLVRRPPSSAVWILYQNMMRVWNGLFTPATLAVVIALGLLCYAVFQPTPLLAVLGIATAFAGALWWYVRRFRPVLGTDD